MNPKGWLLDIQKRWHCRNKHITVKMCLLSKIWKHISNSNRITIPANSPYNNSLKFLAGMSKVWEESDKTLTQWFSKISITALFLWHICCFNGCLVLQERKEKKRQAEIKKKKIKIWWTFHLICPCKVTIRSPK